MWKLLYIIVYGGFTMLFPMWLFLTGHSIGVWNWFWTAFMFGFAVLFLTISAVHLEAVCKDEDL